MMGRLCWIAMVLLLVMGRADLRGDEPARQGPAATDEKQKADSAETADADRQAELFKKFTDQMSGVKMVGHFTIQGKETPPKEEEYTIKSVSKLPQNDLWLFTARVKYGDRDLTLPMPLPVKWADDTPVISLSNLTIPGLGTFSARVVIDGNRYAGTWQHGEVGGHLFGVIEKADAAE